MTVSVGLVRSFSVILGAGETDEDFDRETDAIMENLLALENEHLSDSGVGVDLRGRQVEIEIVAQGDTFDEALAAADAAIRAAIHAAGGNTSLWDNMTIRHQAEVVPA